MDHVGRIETLARDYWALRLEPLRRQIAPASLAMTLFLPDVSIRRGPTHSASLLVYEALAVFGGCLYRDWTSETPERAFGRGLTRHAASTLELRAKEELRLHRDILAGLVGAGAGRFLRGVVH